MNHHFRINQDNIIDNSETHFVSRKIYYYILLTMVCMCVCVSVLCRWFCQHNNLKDIERINTKICGTKAVIVQGEIG